MSEASWFLAIDVINQVVTVFSLPAVDQFHIGRVLPSGDWPFGLSNSLFRSVEFR
jgi:hypothetical protein